MRANTADWEDTVRAGDAAPSFRDVFRRAVRALRDVDVPDDAFDDDRLPAAPAHDVPGGRRPRGSGRRGQGPARPAAPAGAPDAVDAVDDAVRTAVRAAMEEARAVGEGAGPDAHRGPAGTPAAPAAPVVAKPLRLPRPHRPAHLAGGPARAARGPEAAARSAPTRRSSRRRAARVARPFAGRRVRSARPSRTAGCDGSSCSTSAWRRPASRAAGTARRRSRWRRARTGRRTPWSRTCSSPRSTG